MQKKVNTEEGEAINESEVKTETPITESVESKEDTVSYEETIDEKLNSLIAKAEAKAVNEMHFMNFLTESKKNQFNELSEDKQKSIVESMNANSYYVNSTS